FIHGHWSNAYSVNTGFLAFPGILILLAPIAALDRSLHTSLVEVTKNHHLVAHPQTFVFSGPVTPHGALVNFGQEQLAPHPQVFLLLGPYELILSAVALFACDALAQRLGVSWSRRGFLGAVEAGLLWNVAIRWGHPQDALAVGLVIYAVILGLNGRWKGAGWLFGASLAVQPLVIVVLPILLAVAGKERAVGLVARGIAPAVVVTIPPLAGNFHHTFTALSQQKAFPRRNHATPWTTLAPKLGGSGKLLAVGGGPVRLVSLVLAAGLGWWARRWRSKPEMLMWAVALALALRCYTESVMTSYYLWPALAVALVVAARCESWRFAVAVAAAIFTSIAAQWNLGEFPWWAIDVVGITVVLAAAAAPAPTPEMEPKADRVPVVASVRVPQRSRQSASKKKSRKASRVNQRRGNRR
ncbi:MAG TPA: hypothetical protein VID75_02130, partial [Acidimicrobiales bacterium]